MTPQMQDLLSSRITEGVPSTCHTSPSAPIYLSTSGTLQRHNKHHVRFIFFLDAELQETCNVKRARKITYNSTITNVDIVTSFISHCHTRIEPSHITSPACRKAKQFASQIFSAWFPLVQTTLGMTAPFIRLVCCAGASEKRCMPFSKTAAAEKPRAFDYDINLRFP